MCVRNFQSNHCFTHLLAREGLFDGTGYLLCKNTTLIVATITSLAIGQDRFSWTQTFAIVFICAGVYLVEVAESRDKSPDPLKK